MRSKKLLSTSPGVFAHRIYNDEGVEGFAYRNFRGEDCRPNGVLDKDYAKPDDDQKSEEVKLPE